MKKFKKLFTMLAVSLVVLLSLVACGSDDIESHADRIAALEGSISILQERTTDDSLHIATLEAGSEYQQERIAELESQLAEVQEKLPAESASTETSEGSEESEEPQKNYAWDGEYPDFVYEDDVLDYWKSLDCSKLTVIKPRRAEIYTGGDQPSEFWEVDSDVYIGEDGRGGMWYLEEAGGKCLLLEGSVVRLLPDGETEVFLDNVVGYGGWDNLLVIYQLCDGVLSLYEQTSDYDVTKEVITTDVTEAELYFATFNDPILFRKNDGTAYYFDAYGWGDDVAPEELGLKKMMNINRLLRGDTSVFIPLGNESLEYYRQWIEDYREEFIASDDPDMLYPIPALLAEFAN